MLFEDLEFTKRQRKVKMKYFIVVFAATIFAVGLVEAQAPAPVQSNLNNLLPYLKQYLSDVVDALASNVGYVPQTFVDRWLSLTYT